MLGSIDFAKRIIGSARTVSEQTMPAVATSDSADGVVTVAVGKPLEDPDGNPVPVFDEDGNEVGQDMDNKSEVANIGRVDKDDPVVMAGGIVTGTPGWGDSVPNSLVQGGDSIKILDTGDMETLVASFSGDGLVMYGFGVPFIRLYDDGLQGLSVSGSVLGEVKFVDGIELVSDLVAIHGNASFQGDVSMPSKMQSGAIGAANVTAGSYLDTEISFDTSFQSAPNVTVGLVGGAQTVGVGQCSVGAVNVTKNGFTLRRYNAFTSDRTFGASWIATV